MGVHPYWLKIIYERKSNQTSKNYNERSEKSSFELSSSKKLWHLDAWIYQVISSVIGSVRAYYVVR